MDKFLKSNRVVKTLLELVDQYFVLWLDDKSNSQYIRFYNAENNKFLIHLETLFYFIFYVDVLAFAKLGKNGRDTLMVEVKNQMYDSIPLKYNIDLTKGSKESFSDLYNLRISNYGEAYVEYQKTKDQTKDTAWIYSKIIYALLNSKNDKSDFSDELRAIMYSVVGISAFFKYYFWSAVDPLFKK